MFSETLLYFIKRYCVFVNCILLSETAFCVLKHYHVFWNTIMYFETQPCYLKHNECCVLGNSITFPETLMHSEALMCFLKNYYLFWNIIIHSAILPETLQCFVKPYYIFFKQCFFSKTLFCFRKHYCFPLLCFPLLWNTNIFSETLCVLEPCYISEPLLFKKHYHVFCDTVTFSEAIVCP